MPRKISSATSADILRKQARRWMKALRSGDARRAPVSSTRISGAPREPVLRDVQLALAREHGHENWKALLEAVAAISVHVEPTPDRPLLSPEDYDALARDYVLAFNSRDEAALDRLNRLLPASFTFDDLRAEIWRRGLLFRQRAFRSAGQNLEQDEARSVLAQDAGFAAGPRCWTRRAPARQPFPLSRSTHLPTDLATPAAERSGMGSADRGDDERRITELDAGGLITDDVLARIAQLDHVTSLSLGGSRQLTDDGLLHLARMPQLQYLDLSEYPGGRLTDRGLEVLRHLPNLRRFEMTWQSGISDTGVANLRFCDLLEQVNLMGSPTGTARSRRSQASRACGGSAPAASSPIPGCRCCTTFRGSRSGTESAAATVGPDSENEVGHLLIDGPFTDRGFAGLAGPEGVADLDPFWHVSGLTSEGFAALRGLPNLLSFAADGRLSDDLAMRHIAAIPRLRNLRAQESVATDEGFEALGRSSTLEGFWGRVCPNFGNRAFRAFSKMPALKRMGVGCANVDDDVLAAFPDFPALRELTPIGVQDAGFRHIGRCERLERLTCMHCRETTDEATAHVAGLTISTTTPA